MDSIRRIITPLIRVMLYGRVGAFLVLLAGFIIGYSNGAALAVHQVLSGVDHPSSPSVRGWPFSRLKSV